MMSTDLIELSFATIEELDGGRVSAGVDREMRRCIEDVTNRPGDKSARKIVLTIEIKPKGLTDAGDLDTVEVACKVTSKCPARQSAGDVMLVSGSKLMLNPRNRENPRQETILFTGEQA